MKELRACRFKRFGLKFDGFGLKEVAGLDVGAGLARV